MLGLASVLNSDAHGLTATVCVFIVCDAEVQPAGALEELATVMVHCWTMGIGGGGPGVLFAFTELQLHSAIANKMRNADFFMRFTPGPSEASAAVQAEAMLFFTRQPRRSSLQLFDVAPDPMRREDYAGNSRGMARCRSRCVFSVITRALCRVAQLFCSWCFCSWLAKNWAWTTPLSFAPWADVFATFASASTYRRRT